MKQLHKRSKKELIEDIGLILILLIAFVTINT